MSQTLGDLAVGSLVKIGATIYNQPIIMKVLEHDHDGEGLTTLESEKIISFKCFDGSETGNSYGNNRYSYSNILQWLNSDAAAGQWYTAKHENDTAPSSSHCHNSYDPYDEIAGFMYGWSTDLKNAIATVTKRSVLSANDYEDVDSKIFLLAKSELGLASSGDPTLAEGDIYEYYSNHTTATYRVKYPTAAAVADTDISQSVSSAARWFLRTSGLNENYSMICFIETGGSSNSGFPYDSRGIVPAFCISSDTVMSDSTDSDNCYTVSELKPAPSPSPSPSEVGAFLDYAGLTYYNQKIHNDIPSKVSDLTNDSGFITESEVEAKGYVTHDTTYTLAADTTNNQITLTPSSGTAQAVTVPYATNAGTVNGKTVEVDVPANAVFTDTTDLTSMTGTLGVAHGGTGQTSLTAGSVLVGNGTSAVNLKAIDTTAGGTQNSTDLITSGAVYSLAARIAILEAKISSLEQSGYRILFVKDPVEVNSGS